MAEDYPLTSTHWGVYRAEVRDGKLVKLLDFEDDEDGLGEGGYAKIMS